MKDDGKRVPKWLERIQQNSWEPEILLSGFVVVGLLQLPAYIRQAAAFFRAEVLGNNLAGLFSGLQIAVYTLVGGLIIHLFLRGVWIGYVGLSYAFPRGINGAKLKLQPRFQASVDRILPLEKQIDRLEKVCSSIFSLCFFMMMCILGVLMAILTFIGFVYLLDFVTFGTFLRWFYSIFQSNLDTLINGVIIFVALDFIFVGLFRRNKWIGRLYFPFHWLIGWMTLSRFYRPIYYTFATNVNRWAFGSALLLFFTGTIFFQRVLLATPDESLLSKTDLYSRGMEHSFFSGYYQDRNDAWSSVRAVIPAPVVSGRFLELTLKHDISFEEEIFRNCGILPDSLANNEKADSIRIRCVTAFYSLFINDVKYKNVDWMFYFYQKDKAKSLITFLDTGDLDPGKHELVIKTTQDTNNQLARIIFYKE